VDGLGFRINPRGSEDSIFCMFSEVSENSWKKPNTAGGRHFSKHFSKFSSKCPFKNFQMEKFHLLKPSEPHPGTYQRLLLEGFHTSSYPSKWRLAAHAGSVQESFPPPGTSLLTSVIFKVGVGRTLLGFQ